MVNGYAKQALRMAVIASAIALSGNAYAGDHGRYTKRHNLTCTQIVLMALGLSAVAQGMECRLISGKMGDQPFATNLPICDSQKLTVSTSQATINAIFKTGDTKVNLIKKTPCDIEKVIKDNGLQGEAELCVPLHNLTKEHLKKEVIAPVL